MLEGQARKSQEDWTVIDGDVVSSVDNPVLNGPFDPPTRHFVIGAKGPTGEVREGRRPSESFIPCPLYTSPSPRDP